MQTGLLIHCRLFCNISKAIKKKMLLCGTLISHLGTDAKVSGSAGNRQGTDSVSLAGKLTQKGEADFNCTDIDTHSFTAVP